MSGMPGEDIRAAREARGWDQGELARAVGVGQQTVSRWERGETTPRGGHLDRLQAVLELQEPVTPPRRPLLQELPFNRLDPDQFKAFAQTLLMRLHPDAREVHRYGVSGDEQHGIDIRVVTADGERVGVQCKRYAKFQPSSFTKAVAELDPERARVDRCVLFLSTRAGTVVRDTCDEQEGWDLWDARDLSDRVHQLPPEQSVPLVEKYFPGLREEFLGFRRPSPWLTADDAFPVAGQNPVCSHELELVGRQDILESLLAFADGSGADSRVAVLTGDAGQGKSRLLYELARVYERQPGVNVRVLLREHPVAPEGFDQLPFTGPLLVLVEDAHERTEDLAMVVSGVLRGRSAARIVLATRPYGSRLVQEALRVLRIDGEDLLRQDLKQLDLAEARRLGSAALGEGHELAARSLAQVAGDSPLLMISAAKAMLRGELTTHVLERDGDPRRQLLDVFVRSALADSPSPDDDRALLHAVAALQPLAADAPAFQNALSGLMEVPFTRIAPRLGRLEDNGVLARRGASLRIVPDLLGDVLLAEAAVDPVSGLSMGYVERIRECAQGDALSHALVNAGRVDWQRDSGSAWRDGLVDPLWQVLETEFKSGGAFTRAGLLRLVLKVALFQPRRAFELARWALDNPTDLDDRPEEAGWMPGAYSQADVQKEALRVLEAAAVDLDLLRGVYDLLWSLGRNDRRSLPQNPDAPLRILSDLASYVPGKPVAYQEILLDALTDWLPDSEPTPENRMPLALLDPLFSSTAESRESDGLTLTIGRHPVRAQAVASVRERATGILLHEYGAGDEARAVLAAQSFEKVLRSQARDFLPYNLLFLRSLAERTRSLAPGPLTAVAVRRSLVWFVRRDSDGRATAAQRVLDALPDSTEHRLALLLHTGPFDSRFRARRADDASTDTAWTAMVDRTHAEMRAWSVDHSAECLVSLTENGHRVLGVPAAGVDEVVRRVVAETAELASALVDRLSRAEDLTNTLMLPSVLRAWAVRDVEGMLNACRRIVADGNSVQLAAVTQAVRVLVRDEPVRGAEALALVRPLAGHPAPEVRAAVLGVAVSQLRLSRQTGLDLLTSVRFSDIERDLSGLWWTFTMDGALSWSDLGTDQRDYFLRELADFHSLDDYGAQEFVAHIAVADGRDAVALLRARVERFESNPGDKRFSPVPFEWSVPLPFSTRPDRLELLLSVRDWFAQPRERPGVRALYAPKLFWTIAGHADDAVLDLLLEPYRTGAVAAADVTAALFSGIAPEVVWERVDYVTDLLRAAERLSETLYGRTAAGLYSAVISGVRWGTPGEPYPKDIVTRDNARRIREQLARGSAVDRFYMALEEHAERQIQWAAREDPRD